jgi:hypothetical protein
MAKAHSHSWTPEKLAAANPKTLDTIHKNAVRLGANELVEMCVNEIDARASKKRSQGTQARHSENSVVTGYHFVCQRDRGVVPADAGRFWTGSWVVAEANVRTSVKYGAYLALHETKSDTSYRQGQILDFRRSPRDMLSHVEEGGKIEEGIEFLVQETSEPYSWVGAGSGEKGYLWTKLVTTPRSETGEDAEQSR